MKLFIIGNGFDLGHGLPTRYWDFRCFLEENYYDFLAEFERAYGLFQFEEPWSNVEQWRNEDRYGREKILWSQFEKNLPEIEEKDIISSCTDLDLGLESGDHYIEDMLRDYFLKKYRLECHDFSSFKVDGGVRVSEIVSNGKLISVSLDVGEKRSWLVIDDDKHAGVQHGNTFLLFSEGAFVVEDGLVVPI